MAQPRTSQRSLPTRGATAAAPASHGSQTVLQTEHNPETPSATLRLRGEPSEGRRIQWAEDVIDNEHMGKKSSKVCCIYHGPHEPGDSSSDSSSSDSDSEPDLSKAKKAGGSGKNARGRKHDHDDKDGKDGGEGSGKGKERRPSPNAYERQPKPKAKKEG